MKSTKFRRQAEILALILAGSMFFTSCNLGFGGSDASKAIEKVVESYLDDIQSGTFTKDEYASDFADDTPFADLSFADDAVKEIMDKGLEQMTYKITDAEGSVKDEEGTCDVTVTAVDVEQVLSDLEEDGMDADTLMSAITDKDAPTTDNKITLDLTYDADSKDWIVSDSGPLSEILGDPYTEITFGPDVGDPLGMVDELLTALIAADTDTVDSLSPAIDSTYFFPEDNVKEIAARQALYSYVSYTSESDPVLDGDNVNVDVSISMPDITSIVSDVSEDTEFMATCFKSIILAEVQGTDSTAAEDEATSLYSEELISRISASDAPTLTTDGVFVLEPGTDANTWVFSEIPPELYDFDTSPITSDEAYQNAMIRSVEMLLSDGSIDQATYDELIVSLGGSVLPKNTMATDVESFHWYDYVSATEVTSYDSATATAMECEVTYNNTWPGTAFTIDWYNQNGTNLIFTMDDVMGDDWMQYWTWIDPETAGSDGETMPADTYRVVFSLADGTVIVDESIICY